MFRIEFPQWVETDVLVVGIGNPDRGDGGFGPAVASRLRGRVPPGVCMIERSGDVLSLIAEWAGIFAGVVVDAAAQISQPGRVHRLDLSHRSLLPALRAVPPMPSALPRLSSLHAAWTARHLIAYLVEGELFDVGTPLSPVVAEAADELVERIIVELARVSAARQAEGAAEHA